MFDCRTGSNVQHGMTALLRQSVYRWLPGYEDVNDAERLSVDPMLRHVVGGPPPCNPGELTFLLVSTCTPAVVEFTGPDAGQTAHYMLRWFSTRGEARPWSETASATVGA